MKGRRHIHYIISFIQIIEPIKVGMISRGNELPLKTSLNMAYNYAVSISQLMVVMQVLPVMSIDTTGGTQVNTYPLSPPRRDYHTLMSRAVSPYHK